MLGRRAILKGLGAHLLLPVHQGARPREVLAFHYGWYGLDEGWDQGVVGGRSQPHQPAFGRYESASEPVVARQIATAVAAGVTGFITSWDGMGGRRDEVLERLLDAAPEGFGIAPYLESSGGGVEALARRLDDLGARLRDHPRALRVGSQPCIFVFDRVLQEVGLEGWLEACSRSRGDLFVVGPANNPEEIAARRGAFGAVHIYSMQFQTDGWLFLFGLRARAWMQRWVQAQNGLALSTATILPGYDDRHLPDRPGDRPVTPRRDGETFLLLWQAARAARPDWILIVSWNEWLEATEIESSVEIGERELDTTRSQARLFLDGA